MINLTLQLFILMLVTEILFCTDYSSTQITGGSGSDVEAKAAVIIGTVVDTDGAPQVNANVRLRPENYLSGDIFPASSGKINRKNTTTDTSGMFIIDSVDSGKYCIEVISGDTLGVIITFEVNPDDTIKNIVQSILMPMATISGYIDITNNNPSNVTIRLYGLDHSTRPDASNHFSLNVPYGHHRISIDADFKINKHVDTVNVNPGGVYIYERYNLPEPCNDWECDSQYVSTFLERSIHSSLPVDSVVVKRNNRVIGLYLRGLGLTHLSPLLTGLTALEQFDCGNNALERLPAFLMQFTRLEQLKCDSNNISVLPEDLGTLANLRVMDLSNNILQVLPVSIINLSLVELDVQGNLLCDLQNDISQWLIMQDDDYHESQRCHTDRLETED